MNLCINLTLDELNFIIGTLTERPYKEVAELIGKLQIQGEQQLAEIRRSESVVESNKTTDEDKTK